MIVLPKIVWFCEMYSSKYCNFGLILLGEVGSTNPNELLRERRLVLQGDLRLSEIWTLGCYITTMLNKHKESPQQGHVQQGTREIKSKRQKIRTHM